MRDDSGSPLEEDQAVSDEGRLTRSAAKWRCPNQQCAPPSREWGTALAEGCGGAGFPPNIPAP